MEEEPIKKRRGRPPRPKNPEPVEFNKSLFRKAKDEDKPKKERKARAPRQAKVILESEKKINCGFTDKDPRKWRDGTEAECLDKKQFRLYGLNKISVETVAKAKKNKDDEKQELDKIKIQLQINKNVIQIKSRMKKIDEADEKTKERLKAEIAQLRSQNQELKQKL
jgi:hypothetical protein